jgi:pimeloyl-ACP methyl ester carboxylesterase
LGIAEQAGVVARVVDRAGLARPLVVGHSMGTQVATELALAHPEHVGALVLVGPVADPSAPTAVGHALRLARDTVAEPPRLAAIVLREYVRSGVRSYAQTLPHMLGYPLHQRVAGVRAPVAVVRGSRDPIASREFVELLARTAPCGEALEVPGDRHLAMASHPHAVAAVCRRLGQRPP